MRAISKLLNPISPFNTRKFNKCKDCKHLHVIAPYAPTSGICEVWTATEDNPKLTSVYAYTCQHFESRAKRTKTNG